MRHTAAMFLAALVLVSCGPTVSYQRRVRRDPMVVSGSDGTVWFTETWNDGVREGQRIRVRQRTSIVVCRPDRVPTCIRVEPSEVDSRAGFEEWIASEHEAEPSTGELDP